MTACVLVRRGPRWLLSVRGAEVGYAAGRLGLIGGHVEDDDPAEDVLEATARRELIERSSNCPHGRPTTLRIKIRDLERQFGRG